MTEYSSSLLYVTSPYINDYKAASPIVATNNIAHSNLHFTGYILMNDNMIYKFNSVNIKCGKTGEIKG